MNHTPSNENLYNIAALMERRFARVQQSNGSLSEAEAVLRGLAGRNLDAQLQIAGNAARAAGKSYDGCGASISANNGTSGQDQLGASGYGNKTGDEDKLGSRWFTCPKGHSNYRRVANVPEQNCKTCGADVSCKPSKPAVKSIFDQLLRHTGSKPAVARRNQKTAKHEQSKSVTNVGKKVLMAM